MMKKPVSALILALAACFAAGGAAAAAAASKMSARHHGGAEPGKRARAGAAKPGSGRTVKYQLTAQRGPKNLSGKKTVPWALSLNGSIPAPVLEFVEGDTAEIQVTNQIPGEELSIHWHGILLDPEMDGVPYLTTPPIAYGQSHRFRFKLRQHGTYWYHSHTGLQEQRGLYGAIVIYPRKNRHVYHKQAVAVLSDWSDEHSDQIMKNLRKDGEYYRYKKNTVRSLFGAIRAGGLKGFLLGEWTRMGGMDLSDVGYEAFLINGRPSSQLLKAKKGEAIRLRLINAAASSFFYVSLAGLPMKVISADGMDIQPVEVKELLMGMGETYDVLFKLPEQKNYELRATVQDVTGYASAYIGGGAPAPAPEKPKPDLYAVMQHAGHSSGGHKSHAGHKGHHKAHHKGHHSHADHAGHKAHKRPHHKGHHKKHEKRRRPHVMPEPPKPSSAGERKRPAPQRAPDSSLKPKTNHHHASGAALKLLTADHIRAIRRTDFPSRLPRHKLKLVLGGDMERYVWHINGKAAHQEQTIKVREGDVIQFVFENETMMHHPMHLHGHFFRVLNQGGELSPLKHTVDVPPHGRRVIEFLANEPGEWMLHCHNLYHMKTGMSRIVRYSGFAPQPEIAKWQGKNPMLRDDIYFSGSLNLATNRLALSLKLSRSWDSLEAELEGHSYKTLAGLRADFFYKRWMGRFFHFIAGGEYLAPHQNGPLKWSHVRRSLNGLAGFGYTLPMLVEVKALINHRGKFRFDLEKRFQWTKYLFTDAEVIFRQGAAAPDLEASLMFANSPVWSAGLQFQLIEPQLGAGASWNF